MENNSLLKEYQASFNDYLNDYVATFKSSEALEKVIKYNALGEGKLFRPILTAAIARAYEIEDARIKPIQLAVELVHVSSLMHDDLPCLDNDEIRRGKPSSHKVFGEGLTLLSGDYLLSEASRWILNMKEDPSIIIEITKALNTAICDMCEGQILDLEIRDETNLSSLNNSEKISKLQEINLKKTGALIRFSILAPLNLLEDLSGNEAKAIKRYANNLSVLYQLCDDLKDEVQDTRNVEYREINYVQLMGIEKCIKYADTLVQDPKLALEPLGEKTAFLKFLVEFVRAL